MMGIHERFPPAPPAAVSRILATFDRAELEGFIAVAIDLLDLAEPDPDLEPNGDELDGSLAEDDFTSHSAGALPGPGCPISDPDLAVDDDPCDDQFEDLEPDEPLAPVYGVDQSAVAIDYTGMANADRRIMKPHVKRIRRTRCAKVIYRNGEHYGEYRLREATDDPDAER